MNFPADFLKFTRTRALPLFAQTLIISDLLCFKPPSTMQLMNTMMIAPRGHSSLLIMHSTPHAITNDQTLHIIAHHLADVLRWLGSPRTHTPAIKISLIEHINYTHPQTAMITISHVWMDYGHLPQNCRGRAMTLANGGGGAVVVEAVGLMWRGGVVRNSPESRRCRICGRMDADSSWRLSNVL